MSGPANNHAHLYVCPRQIYIGWLTSNRDNRTLIVRCLNAPCEWYGRTWTWYKLVNKINNYTNVDELNLKRNFQRACSYVWVCACSDVCKREFAHNQTTTNSVSYSWPIEPLSLLLSVAAIVHAYMYVLYVCMRVCTTCMNGTTFGLWVVAWKSNGWVRKFENAASVHCKQVMHCAADSRQ